MRVLAIVHSRSGHHWRFISYSHNDPIFGCRCGTLVRLGLWRRDKMPRGWTTPSRNDTWDLTEYQKSQLVRR